MMVFVTQTGSKYHARTDLRCLENAIGTSEIPIETAVAGGLLPCVACDAPPVPESTEGDRQWLRAIDDWGRQGIFESFWEQAFARRILALTPGISSDDVELQSYISVAGETYKVDFSVPKANLVIEVDGYAKDGSPLSASEIERRNRRDAALQTHGLTVLHFSNAQVQQEPQACRAQLSKAVSARDLGDRQLKSSSQTSTLKHDAIGVTSTKSGNVSNKSDKQLWIWIGLGAVAVAAAIVSFAMFSVSSSTTTAPSPDRSSSVATAQQDLIPIQSNGWVLANPGGACPDAYPIKGNINRDSGEKIAHSPGQQFYDQTDAEQCFPDLVAAEAAGFRASKK